MARRRKPTRGERVAQEAREWVGTRFVWQASQKQVGCDCKGLLWGVARELGFPEAESLYAKVADYSPTRPVPSALLKEGFASIFDRVPVRVAAVKDWIDAKPGHPAFGVVPDCFALGAVMILRPAPGAPAGHVAIVTGPDCATHAQIGEKNWVKETKLRALLKTCPLDSIWRWRDER